MDAVHGLKKDLRISRRVLCGSCTGTGVEPNEKITTCQKCKGKGMVRNRQKRYCLLCFIFGREVVCVESRDQVQQFSRKDRCQHRGYHVLDHAGFCCHLVLLVCHLFCISFPTMSLCSCSFSSLSSSFPVFFVALHESRFHEHDDDASFLLLLFLYPIYFLLLLVVVVVVVLLLLLLLLLLPLLLLLLFLSSPPLFISYPVCVFSDLRFFSSP